MDVSPYLRKPLRSLQEVVETLKPASSPEAAVPEDAVRSEQETQGDPRDAAKS